MERLELPSSPPPLPPRRGCVAVFTQTVCPLLLLALVQCIFSGYSVLTDAALKTGTAAPVFALFRDLVACAAFAPTLFAVERGRPPGEPRFLWPRREHAGHFLLLGFLGVWGGQLLGSISISFLSASLYGLLTPTVPAATLLISYLLGLETFRPLHVASWLKVLGIAVSIAGACVIVLVSPNGSEGKNNSLGLAYIVAQKLCLGAYPVLQKHMLAHFGYPSLTLATWAYLLGSLLIMMTTSVSSTDPAGWAVSSTSLGALFYSGLLSSFFGYAAMAWVNARTSPVLVTAFYPLQSLMTPLLSSTFLGTTVLSEDIYGGAIVVLGLGLCIAGRLLDGAPATGVVEEDDDAEASTVTLSIKEVEMLVEAAQQADGDDKEDMREEPLRVAASEHRRRRETFAEVAAPIFDRALSKRVLGGDELSAMRKGVPRTHSGLRSGGNRDGALAPLTAAGEARRRVLQRQSSVVVEA